jgi:hypothetical protein
MAQKDLHVPSSISLLPLPPRHAPSSTTRKTSGSSCVRTGCRTASSNLQRHRRSLLLRLEHPDRSVLENHVHRSSRFGRCRSLFARTDISLRTAPLTHSNPAKAVGGIEPDSIFPGLPKQRSRGTRSSGPTRFTSHQSGSRWNERRTCETDMRAIMRLYWRSIERANIVGAIRRFGLLPDLP